MKTRLTAFLFCMAFAAAASAVERPNIIFILADDMGWPQTTARMHPDQPESAIPYLETPALDKLARQGRRFSSGYAPAPICTPTRRSILAGMTTARTRGSEFASDFDPKKYLCLPQALKKVDPNYCCAHFGKWGEQMNAAPEEVGYDESDGPTGNPEGFIDSGAKDMVDIRLTPGCTIEDPKRTFFLTKRSIDFIERQTRAKKPFYLQLSLYALHHQLQATEASAKKYEAKGEAPRDFPTVFAAMLEDMDRGIGMVLDAVDRLGITDKTYVVFSADNGGEPHNMFGFPVNSNEKANPRSPNYPLRAYKQTLYEGGIRVPFFVRGPGIAADSWCHVPVAQYDLLPTFVELAGGDPRAMYGDLDAVIDGGSIKTLMLTGEGEVRRSVPGLVFHRPDNVVSSAYRNGDYKIFHHWRQDKTSLYDLSKDLGEADDLAAKMPEKLAAMKETLMNYLAHVDAEKFTKERDEKIRAQQQKIGQNMAKKIEERKKQQAEQKPE